MTCYVGSVTGCGLFYIATATSIRDLVFDLVDAVEGNSSDYDPLCSELSGLDEMCSRITEGFQDSGYTFIATRVTKVDELVEDNRQISLLVKVYEEEERCRNRRT